MSDQHRADVTGCYGNDIVRTPVLDRLAAEGAVFDQAYTPAPICVPGRMCLMSGQLPQSCDCHRYGDDLPPNHMTFARALAQYGYNTACAGKLHHMGSDQMQGWTARMGWHDIETHPKAIEGKNEVAYRAFDGPRQTWSIDKELERAGVARSPYAANDETTLHAALEYIDQYFNEGFYERSQAHRPLLLKVSLMQPHYPFVTDRARFDYYHDRVPIFDPETEPTIKVPELNDQPGRASSDAAAIRRATAAYYGMVDQVDGQFGQVLKAIEATGQDLDDWLIIYTSDHGEMLGQHGQWWKHKFWEASVRVPLIARYPKAFGGGQRIEQNVSLCDLFATLCDYGNCSLPEGLDSRSLRPLLEESEPEWDNEAIAELMHDRLMIKRDALKYQRYGSGHEVLFDHAADPDETENRIAHPQYQTDLRTLRRRADAIGYLE